MINLKKIAKFTLCRRCRADEDSKIIYMHTTLLLGTRKGLIAYHLNGRGWKVDNVSFEGQPVSIAYCDPRTQVWWACLDHGHWGVKLHRSVDRGGTWEEMPGPAYPQGEEVKEGIPAATRYIWSMSQGGRQLTRLWIGTDPEDFF